MANQPSPGRPGPASDLPDPSATVDADTGTFHGASPAAGDGSGRLALQPGARPLPDYELVQFLGRGGFGKVWKARGPGAFDLALKFIDLDDNAGALELRSLEVMKGVRHPNLLVLFGCWQRDGYLIVAMELADRSLMDRLNEARGQGLPGIPQAELLKYVAEAAQGIDHLNGLGVQHRDVKAHNLLLAGGGVKVADFGLAKELEHARASHSGGMTLHYAAPEFFADQVSAYSDQYSLAVTYCELRGGRLPFVGNQAAVTAGHLKQAPDLTMLPEAERPVLARALAKKPAKRWPSCTAFVAALTAAVAGSPTPRAVRRMWPVWTGLLLLTGVLAVALILWMLAPVNRSPSVEEVVNSLHQNLVRIEPGTFTMGSPKEEMDRFPDEGPQHEVKITRPFDLGKYPVTQEEYEKATGLANPSSFSKGKGGGDKVAGLDTRRFPVESVTWDEAVAFCKALNLKDMERPEGWEYRLPTEAEWEYACRAGTKTAYFFDDPKPLGDYAWFADNSGGRPHEVGTRKPNPWGLYDMHGNVWQWCGDWYGAYQEGSFEDPKGPDSGGRRVLRGGSWSFGRRGDCRAAYRYDDAPGYRYGHVGFRVVLAEAPGTP